MSESDFFEAARALAGGYLNQSQVNELNKIVYLLTKKGQLDKETSTREAQSGGKTSESGIRLITSFEGIKLHAYDDGVGVWTIGIGTTVYPNGERVKRGDSCTEEQAREYLAHDLKKFEACVNQYVRVSLNQHQYDALISLVYNIGAGAFRGSTLLKKLNTGDYTGAADEFLRWNKGGHRVLPGLDRRRKSESYF